ncbi:hypothetical protein Dip510_001936 [Elusimicrobium posterum]|uniref:hypothetical protein n=1 Tax=Elusimicrobium posterum TaxID=3116653 RepID=UPI003C711FC1
MILQDIYAYLKQDDTLAGLLSATEKDSKIYPNIAKIMTAPPFLVYKTTTSGGARDEILSEEGVRFLITASSYQDVIKITERINFLLDLADYIPSDKYFICYAKHTGGEDYLDELGRNIRTLNFNLKFRRK